VEVLAYIIVILILSLSLKPMWCPYHGLPSNGYLLPISNWGFPLAKLTQKPKDRELLAAIQAGQPLKQKKEQRVVQGGGGVWWDSQWKTS
jgi:hypothetical protein